MYSYSTYLSIFAKTNYIWAFMNFCTLSLLLHLRLIFLSEKLITEEYLHNAPNADRKALYIKHNYRSYNGDACNASVNCSLLHLSTITSTSDIVLNDVELVLQKENDFRYAQCTPLCVESKPVIRTTMGVHTESRINDCRFSCD